MSKNETVPGTLEVRSVAAGKEANRLTARCAHGRAEVRASWEEMDDADARAGVMRRLVAAARAQGGCACGEEILAELGEE